MIHYCSMTEDGTQRRHAMRRKMFEPVVLSFGGLQARAHFLDLSCSGALVHSETPPPSGRYLSVTALGLRTSGRVMWAKGKRFGIQFSTPLAQEEMDELIRGG
ncbi:MAG TPA: PilZ domain-containing protein [Sphingobium sp.]|nr:PilZ domain-containing protein [Sphingobium sp.]